MSIRHLLWSEARACHTDQMSKKDGSIRHLLRVPVGQVDVLRDFDPGANPGFPKGMGKDDVDELADELDPEIDYRQEQMYAEGLRNPEGAPSILLVLQGLDTAGKGGVIRHVIGMIDPQGVKIHSFKKPTPEELTHDFLWRVRNALPGPGDIGIFDRSHYEDVLVQRVEKLATPEEIERRYRAINDFEAEVVASGIHIIKCYLHISRGEQRQRLLARLGDPEKYYKYNPGDVDTAWKFDEYMEAFNIALTRCNTDVAPWYVVPSDDKWYRNWAVAQLLLETLEDLQLGWPGAQFDVEAERARVQALPAQ